MAADHVGDAGETERFAAGRERFTVAVGELEQQIAGPELDFAIVERRGQPAAAHQAERNAAGRLPVRLAGRRPPHQQRRMAGRRVEQRAGARVEHAVEHGYELAGLEGWRQLFLERHQQRARRAVLVA